VIRVRDGHIVHDKDYWNPLALLRTLKGEEVMKAVAPFCPGGRNVCPRCRAVEELNQVRRLAAFRQHLEECLEYPGAAEPPEPLPYAVPFAVSAGECAPPYAVYSEVVDSLEEFTVIMPRLSPARLRRIKHF
jgi:hypothetical protein